MAILIANDLPAFETLKNEDIEIQTEKARTPGGEDALQILILNLMPTKIETETQLLRLLGKSKFKTCPVFLKLETYVPKNTPKEHMDRFYKGISQMEGLKFDGMIITGAPVEHMDFEDVSYWKELESIFEFASENVRSTINICWAAQASLYFHYDIPKHLSKKKICGVFKSDILKSDSPLFEGLSDFIISPHSRYSYNLERDIWDSDSLEILSRSEKSGACIVQDTGMKNIFVSSHMEYDRFTLSKEYARDKNKNRHPDIPENYYPEDDESKLPLFEWDGFSQRFYENWLCHLKNTR